MKSMSLIQMMRTAVGALSVSACLVATGVAAEIEVIDSPDGSASFPLVAGGVAARIVVPQGVPKVVTIAADDLAEDIERVTGVRPEVVQRNPGEGKPVIELRLAADPKGDWETFRLSATPDKLVIDGTDPRGLAFGIYELSRRIGVSPWYWWADVPVAKRGELHLSLGTGALESPAVKYRGIFINDEGWGLRPWAANTHEPDAGNIGPKTYAKIFELLLRLRANSIWPAMHPGTTPFHQMEGNPQVADDYAIVVGSSHAEPMLRNNVGEWSKSEYGDWNPVTNLDTILDYWEQRVKESANYESLWTVGMRGVHDSGMPGGGTLEEKRERLEKIIGLQRDMLAKHVNPDPSEVPQIFVPYKEVLEIYQADMELPEDITIVLPDDNFGYIRRFPNDAERAREGGAGVYYHVSYLGSPMSYLWIDNHQLALTWAEMSRAYEQGARDFWVVNVGDIKNTERAMEYFLDLAWRADETTPEDSMQFIDRVAARDFGKSEAGAIADIVRRLQAHNFDRKAEHTQWHLPETPYQPTELNENEIKERLETSAQLLADSKAVRDRLPADAKDAYFQLVHYPVAVTAAADERYFYAELARLQKARGEDELARETYAKLEPAFEHIEKLTGYYNNEVFDGKWKHIVRNWGMPYTSWYVRYRNTSTLPDLDNEEAQSKVKAAEPLPEPGPLPRPAGARPGDFVERNGVVSIHAGHFTGKQDLASGAGWRAVPGLGRTGSAVTVLPSTAEITDEAAPTLEYRFHVESNTKPKIRVRFLPTFPLADRDALNLALAIDDGNPLPVAVTDGFETDSKEWKFRVLENATTATVDPAEALSPGWHTLRLIAVDAGVVVDKIQIEFEEQPSSYNGPKETRL